MSDIKPGDMCYLVNMEYEDEEHLNGWLVEVLSGPHLGHTESYHNGIWIDRGIKTYYKIQAYPSIQHLMPKGRTERDFLVYYHNLKKIDGEKDLNNISLQDELPVV